MTSDHSVSHRARAEKGLSTMRRLLAPSLAVSVLLLLCASGSALAQKLEVGGSASASQDGVDATATGQTGASGAPTQSAVPAAAPPEAATPAGSATATSAPPSSAVAPAAEPAPTAEAPQTPASQTHASAEPMDAGTYSVRLRDLEHSVNELKEQIFRSKARLSLLAETVLQGVVAGAQARVVHENKMGNSYKLVKIVYALDGAPILNKADEEGGLGEREQFDIYNGSIVPGEHTLTVQLEYRGHGYGIFSYLKGYRFKVTSNHTFTAAEGKVTSLRVVGYEKGGPTAPLEERPAVRYVERVDTPAAPVEAARGAK